MSNEWDDKLTEKFLKLYRKHKCLWNPYSPNYRNCFVKNEAFKTVLDELNDPRIKISECLKQIEVIREKYKEEQVKAESALKFGQSYDSKVLWFNLMSKMLCEVINDEENFIEEPVEFVPCEFARGEIKQDHPAKEFEKLKRIDSPGTKKQHDEKFFDNNYNLDTKLINDKNDPWNKCPSCGWETEDRTYASTDTSKNWVERVVRIDKEIKRPHSRMKSTETDDVDKSSNTETLLSEKDGTSPKKKVKIVEDVEVSEDGREKCDCSEPNKSNATEESKNLSEEECGNDDQTIGNQIVTTNKCGSSIQPFGGYGSKFKIIIPNPDEEDQNLEIIGYEVHGPVAELSKYILNDPGAESPRVAIDGAECSCKNEVSLLGRNGIFDSTRYGNIIKLNISQKRSRGNRPRKRAHEEPDEMEAENKSFATRSTQTESYHGDPTNCSKDQGYASDFSSPPRNRVMDESVPSDSLRDDDDGSIAQADRFNNTRIFLNVIVKMLESGETEVTEELQNTLGSMLDRFEAIQSRSMAHNAKESYNNSHERTRDGTMHRTQYPNLLVAPGPTNTGINNMNPQRRVDNTIELWDDTPNVNSRAQFPFPESYYRGEMSGNDTSYFLPVERRNRPPNQGVNASQQNSRMLNGTYDSMHGSRRSRNATAGSVRGEQNSRYWRGTMSGNDQHPEDGRRDVNRDQDSTPGNDSSYLLPELNGRSNAARRTVDGSQPNSRVLSESITRNTSKSGYTDFIDLAYDSGLADPSDFSRADPLANSTGTSDLDRSVDSSQEPLASSSRQVREPRNQNQLTKDFLDVIRYTMMMDGIQDLDDNGEKNCCKNTNQPTDPRHQRK